MKLRSEIEKLIMNIFQTKFSSRAVRLLTLSILIGIAPVSLGGDEHSEKHLTSEIGFLANKLLKMSGKDTHSIEVAPYKKPFIGICTEITKDGLILTCVTPGTQADKGGLKTGDIVTQIKGLDLVGPDSAKAKRSYYEVVDSMKTGDVITFKLIRNGKNINLGIEVGAISHPGYSLKISK